MGLRILVGLAAIPVLAAGADLAGEANAILQENCQMCHGAAVQQSGLDLRTRDKILTGGERGAAVTGASLSGSWLWKLVTHTVTPFMPPGGKLPDEKIEILRKWILAGAPMPEGGVTDEEAERLEALRKLEERPITEVERSWWSFTTPVRPIVPGDPDRHPVDAFLEAKLREKNLVRSAAADTRTLVRRLYLDLTGLPPSIAEVEEFLGDESPDAWTVLIDRLLESPHYGERWGRHWLDLVHYADSGGFERDYDWPTMWRYRDYVVDAFNNDKPYDQFIREQIAGDEIAPGSSEANIATGFLRMVLDNNIKDERTRMDELDDNVGTTAQTFLAVTAQCARCHSHKFDPIPQKDYYRMQAVFFSTIETDFPLVPPETVAQHEERNKEIDRQTKPLNERLLTLEKPHRDVLFQDRLDALPSYYRIAWETPPEKRTKAQRLNARQVDALHTQIELKDVLEKMSDRDRQEHAEIELQVQALERSRPEPYPTARTISEKTAATRCRRSFCTAATPEARDRAWNPEF